MGFDHLEEFVVQLGIGSPLEEQLPSDDIVSQDRGVSEAHKKISRLDVKRKSITKISKRHNDTEGLHR